MKVLELTLADNRIITVAYELEESLNAFLNGLTSKIDILTTKEITESEITKESYILD